MFHKKVTTAQPHSDISQLRETIREMEERSHDLSNQLLGFDMRSQPTEATLTAQRDLVLTRDLIATLSSQLAELERREAAAHAKAGQDASDTLRLQFVAISNQETAHRQALDKLAEQRANLAKDARQRLAEWPDHLHNVLQRHVPIVDDVTRLSEALISLRRELLKHGDIFGFFERAGLAAPWFRIEIGKREDWARLDLAEVEAWLAAYRQRKAL